ncbi:uncharacterized protein G2W53_044500 [Senna tora]|uniref:Uncharacterized protein n=1 Tax=Senna tora TaxID=362788 RepID=A0A834SC72_9FABA|nr:uncharacterized protein G2W53_044500 [Senna tora]
MEPQESKPKKSKQAWSTFNPFVVQNDKSSPMITFTTH